MDDLSLELSPATRQGEYEIANQPIRSDANVNEAKNTVFDRVTPLHCAVAMGNIQLENLLIKCGTNYNARDSKNCTPLHLVVMTGDYPDVIDMFINGGAVVDARDIHQRTPLDMAVEKNSNESAQKLIAKGASIEAVNIWGWSILHTAMFSKNLSMVKVLISHGVNIDSKNIHGYTPLHCALQHEQECDIDIIRLLLENGADVNVKSRYRCFPLYWATVKHSPARVHLLLKWGARVNEVNDNGNTALHEACKMGYKDVAVILLKFGADINARNRQGKTPFELLQNSRYTEATAQIMIKEAVKIEAVGQPLWEGYKQMVQSCVNYSKFDQECRDEVERMRSEKIDVKQSAMTFFYILSKGEEKIATLLRNKRIVRAFETSDYMALFRIYAGDLTTKFEVAKVRANFLTSTEDCLIDVLGEMLPPSILQNISAYLKCGDIIKS